MSTKGIILAAGRGSRMGSLTANQPKCQTVLHGKSLLQWQLDALRPVCDEVAVVSGYLADSFDPALARFHNPRWAETNMVYSLLQAEAWLAAHHCILSYSDIIYSPQTVARLHAIAAPLALSYDPDWLHLWSARFADPLSDAESFRLHPDSTQLADIGRKVTSVEEIQGQYMGLLSVRPTGWHAIHNSLHTLPAKQTDSMDMTTLLQRLLQQGEAIHTVPVVGPWYEVDSADDLHAYQTLPPVGGV